MALIGLSYRPFLRPRASRGFQPIAIGSQSIGASLIICLSIGEMEKCCRSDHSSLPNDASGKSARLFHRRPRLPPTHVCESAVEKVAEWICSELKSTHVRRSRRRQLDFAGGSFFAQSQKRNLRRRPSRNITTPLNYRLAAPFFLPAFTRAAAPRRHH